MASNGKFIVIEGSDGAGKETQQKLLAKRLEAAGHEVYRIDFPRYDHDSSYFVRQYLKGEYGGPNDVSPYTGSLFYALDRFHAAQDIRQALAEGKVVIADRYVGSNMAHQGSKFSNREERLGFFTWLDTLEFETLGIPRPNLNIVLTVPYDIAKRRYEGRDEQQDIHQRDEQHIRNSIKVYQDLCELFPKNFVLLKGLFKGKELSPEELGHLIWRRLEPMLPKNQPTTPAQTTPTNPPAKASQPDSQSEYLTKSAEGHLTVTAQGHEFLRAAVTNPTDNVYAFTDKLSTATIAAAMARLSRRGDDMRVTILDEFAGKEGKDEGLLNRVITAYGDDSVQQLVGLHMVVENASNLLTKKLEWGRLASYLEQSTRYIYFDQKDARGNYRYFTPTNLDAATAKVYEQTMDTIFDNYSTLVHKLSAYVRHNSTVPKEEQDGAWKGATRAQACDAIRAVLPVATKATVGIFASGQALESLIMHLQSDELKEAQDTGQALLDEARKVIPVFLERADKPDRGGAWVAYRATTHQQLRKLANDKLQQNLSPETEAVKLHSFFPKNELDLLPHMLFEHSGLPLEAIEQEIDTWSYDEKVKAFKAYMGERLNRRHRPGRALEQAHYTWELVCDYGIFRDLQRHRMVDDLQWQELSPRYGYDIPKLVEDAGLTDLFEACFDASFELYSHLQQAGYQLEAQYATLLGHKMRWKITYNAREAFHLHELRTSPQGHPGYRKLVKEMHEMLGSVHPLLAAEMLFVNQGEDAELTRLAAEKYTQYKLEQLEKASK